MTKILNMTDFLHNSEPERNPDFHLSFSNM